jgi:protocatechuate 3,4-dioxygenase beta subunit
MPDHPDRKRRRLVAALGLLSLPASAALLPPTPRQSAGPFYPTELPLDDDNDLTWLGDRKKRAAGEITDLSGRVLDINGKPIAGARVEIWQCDANGRYRHPRDPNRSALDPNFQGHGHVVTDADGGYRFRTIRPVPYPGRTPHIHTAVFLPEERPFVTQIYIAGEPRNQEDFLYLSIPTEQRRLVEAEFLATSGSAGESYRASLDIVLGGTPSQA